MSTENLCVICSKKIMQIQKGHSLRPMQVSFCFINVYFFYNYCVLLVGFVEAGDDMSL